MSKVQFSVALAGTVDRQASVHLLRVDGQEDLCFAIWFPSLGRTRTTALLRELVLPVDGERSVHGNASFVSAYLERALEVASINSGGIALLHSHPDGYGWQGMSRDDIETEQGIAASVWAATDLPLVGLTLAGDGSWSARFWNRTAPRIYERNDCGTVRVIADDLRVSFNNRLAFPPQSNGQQVRTVAAWGEAAQMDLTRLRVGIIGAGSVGSMIGEALARTGFEDVSLIDFDHVEEHNLDRLSYATMRDIGRLKVETMAEHLSERATASEWHAETTIASVCHNKGFRAALDCDLLFSCVDRPWGRYVLNLIAYAHLIPVFDGGISARMNRSSKLAGADWKALTAAPGRQCLQCAGQYDPSLVQMEREGLLDDSSYIEGLPQGHILKARENVFAFSMGCANLQFLQMLAMVLAPLEQSNPGTQLYHFVGNTMETPVFGECHPDCQFPELIGLGDRAGVAAVQSDSEL